MAAKSCQQWCAGDLFALKLADGHYALGQVLDVSIPHTASCAFLSTLEPTIDALRCIEPAAENVVGAATVIDAHLNRAAWKVISRFPLVLAREQWPNELTRAKGWVGSKVCTGAVLEDFLNAYHGLVPSNLYQDPKYLDGIRVSATKKPE